MSHSRSRSSPERPAFLALVALAALLGAGTARAQVLDPVLYSLAKGAMFEYGCHDPCACPIVYSGPMTGGFTLLRTGIDPLFEHYAMSNIDWVYTQSDGSTGPPLAHHVRGSGTFDYGGEVAITERMTLDVSFDGAAPRHFDSGTVVARVGFPAIDIDVHWNLVGCRDSILRVVSKPGGVDAVTPGHAARLLSAPVPDPASGPVALLLSLPEAADVRVDVLDVAGRVVAKLLDGYCDAAQITLHWDGRDGRGVPLGAGIYWVRARAGDRADLRRLVRLDS
jgi:hypothetical protein